MFGKFLKATLPELEIRSHITGNDYAVFIFEEAMGNRLAYFSEKILISEGQMAFRHVSEELGTPEECFQSMLGRIPQGVLKIYEFIKANRTGAIIIVAAPGNGSLLYFN